MVVFHIIAVTFLCFSLLFSQFMFCSFTLTLNQFPHKFWVLPFVFIAIALTFEHFFAGGSGQFGEIPQFDAAGPGQLMSKLHQFAC